MNKDFKKLIGSAIFFIVISSIMFSRADLTNPGIKSLFLLFTTVPIIAVYCQYTVNYKKFGKCIDVIQDKMKITNNLTM